MAKETPTPLADVEALKRENAELKARLNEGELSDDLAKEVKWRMAAGLTRAQAIEAGKAQLAHDKAMAEDAAKKAK